MNPIEHYEAQQRAMEAERYARLAKALEEDAKQPANFCATVDDAREPFDWIDSAVFLCCGAVVAGAVLLASWAGWLA